jgi:hypothetical protein
VIVSARDYEKMAGRKHSLLELFAAHPEIELDLEVDRTSREATVRSRPFRC